MTLMSIRLQRPFKIVFDEKRELNPDFLHYIVESIQNLNFQVGIQTKIQLSGVTTRLFQVKTKPIWWRESAPPPFSTDKVKKSP